MSTSRTDFTGIVVTCNEDERLRACLQSLSFCDEVLVVDLESTDRSVPIARDCGATVLSHDRVPTAGIARKYGAQHASHDWIVYLDPDEVFPASRYPEVCALIDQNPKLGRIFVPWKFYFKGEPLEGTRWGGRQYKGHVIHRDRCEVARYVHQEISLLDEYEHAHLSWEGGGHIEHYWMDSYSNLIEKHIRYVRNEGEARYERGDRFPGWRDWSLHVLRAFQSCFVRQDGWKEGLRGLFLSLLWTWYEGASLLALRRYQRTHTSTDAPSSS